jgi:hypothetical protein
VRTRLGAKKEDIDKAEIVGHSLERKKKHVLGGYADLYKKCTQIQSSMKNTKRRIVSLFAFGSVTRELASGAGASSSPVRNFLQTALGREMSFVFSLDVILFRKVDDHYIYPGELYVDEYIHGKAFDGLDRGERQLVATLRDFLEKELKNLFALRRL